MACQLRQPLRGGRHLLGLRGENVAECDIRRLSRQRDVDLHIIVSGYTQAQPRRLNRLQIGGFKVFLAQMHAVSVVLNRQPPVVVDKQAGVIATPQFNGGHDVGFDLFITLIFNAQLDRAYARLQQAFNPRHAVHHRVKPEAERHGREIRLVHYASSFLR